MAKRRSLFEKLTGTVKLDENYDAFEGEDEVEETPEHAMMPESEPMPQEEMEGELPVDLFQTSDDVVLRAFVAGVPASSLDISISRDMVTISGAREVHDEVMEDNFYSKELFWGAFSRTILLPQEIDVDASAASSKDGLLTIIMPKLDKTKQTKLKVKNG